MRWCAIVLSLLLAIGEAYCQIVDVEGVGTIDFDALECVEVTRSRVIRRICYDEWNQYMLVDVEGRYRLFCRVEKTTVEAFLHTKSMAQFFSQIRRQHSCPGRQGPD